MDRTVSSIAFGAADFGGLCPPALAWELLDGFIEVGGNHIDTARVYGDFKTPIHLFSLQSILLFDSTNQSHFIRRRGNAGIVFVVAHILVPMWLDTFVLVQ